MKRITAACIFLFVLSSFAFAEIHVEAEGAPTSIHISWNEVAGAVHYDIYNGSSPVARLDADAREYTVENLFSDTGYKFCVAARDAGNNDVSYGWVSESTTSWDGVYEWVNETDNDNKGRLRALRMRLETCTDPAYGQYHKVYLITDDAEYQIFPLFPFGSELSGAWIEYDDCTPAGIAYRTNAELFNKSPFVPSRWRVDRIEIDYDATSAYIQTSALGITVTTVSSYHLYMEDGNAVMAFETRGSGIADSVLFKNPNPGEGDAYILRRIQ